MENEVSAKRSLILVLVIGTMVVFIALVWLIATYVPLGLLNRPTPTFTAVAMRVEKNCTNPVSYWKLHPEYYPSELVLGQEVYPAKDIGEMLSNENPDLGPQLQAQLVGAFLNMLSGSNQGPIEITIFQAYDWLIRHPDGSEVAASEVDAGSRLIQALEAYNSGLFGVAPCQTGLVVATVENASPSGTTTSDSTLNPNQMGTSSPSPSPSATIQAVQTLLYASPTPTPTTEEPGGPQLTRTHTPQPTNTPKKTTAAPTSTNTPVNTTQAPTSTNTPITPSPTLPPEPTITPTFPTIPN